MIYYNLNTINDWNFGDDNIIKVYKHGAVVFYKFDSEQGGYKVCFAVVDDISQYSDTEFEDVYDKATKKWFKLNNLNQYEQYGVYGEGRNITYYEGKLTVDDGYEYEWNGSSWVNLGEVSGDTPYDYSQDYLTLQALESGTIGFSASTVDYSTDSGSTWNTLAQGNTISVSQGDEVLFKKSGSIPTENYGIGTFTSSCRFNVYGNIMSMQESDNFATATTIANYEYYFKRLFAESKVVSAENMVLPATTLRNFCYNELFKGSTYLTTPPKILPATVLTQDCYSFSFSECPSLTKSPILPAPTSARASYGWMFQNCTSLSEVTCLATDVSAEYATYDWLSNVASSGTFYKNPNASWDSGDSGIPSGWNVEDYVEPTPYVYPKYYDEKSEPLDNLTFNTMAEAQAYAEANCVYVGLKAAINGDRYIFSGDSQSGYEWVYNPSRLPVGYTEVEYIENPTIYEYPYIDTNFTPNQNTKVVADLQYTQTNTHPRAFGCGTWNDNGYIFNAEGGIPGEWRWKFGYNNGGWLTTSITSDFDRHKVEIDNGNLYLDDVLVSTTTVESFQMSDNIALFGFLYNGELGGTGAGEYMTGKFYSFKIYDNGTLVRDFVPCTRDSDSKTGMYDIVGDLFYTSPNSYNFTAGNPV